MENWKRNELTQRRRAAACLVLWSLAHWIGYTHLDEACQVADWIFRLDPEFNVLRGLLGTLYRHWGFRKTERLLALRRVVSFVRLENEPLKMPIITPSARGREIVNFAGDTANAPPSCANRFGKSLALVKTGSFEFTCRKHQLLPV